MGFGKEGERSDVAARSDKATNSDRCDRAVAQIKESVPERRTARYQIKVVLSAN